MFKGIIRNLQIGDVQSMQDIYALYWADDKEFQEKLVNRLRGAIDQSPNSVDQFTYFVAEQGGEVVGAIGFRRAPEHMRQYAKARDTAEIYILAVKNKGIGAGRALVEKALEEMRVSGYTEAVLYSGDTHKDSWGFYDHLGFQKAGPSIAPNGESGFIWKMEIL